MRNLMVDKGLAWLASLMWPDVFGAKRERPVRRSRGIPMRLLWDSAMNGTYVKAKHGDLKTFDCPRVQPHQLRMGKGK